jgi:hypothetical protein
MPVIRAQHPLHLHIVAPQGGGSPGPVAHVNPVVELAGGEKTGA